MPWLYASLLLIICRMPLSLMEVKWTIYNLSFSFLYRLSVFFSFLFAVFSSAGTVRTPIIVFSEFITFQREKLDDAI